MDSLAEAVKTAGLDERSRSWLAQLLLVRSCAYLEQATLTLIRSYIDAKSGGPVKTFAASWLGRGNTPTTEGLKRLVGRFDQQWANDLADLLASDNEKLHRDLSFLIDRRHQVAHSQSVSVQPMRALELKGCAVTIVNWLVDRFNPTP